MIFQLVFLNIFINFLFLTTPSTRQLSGQASLPLTTIYHVANQKSLFCSDDIYTTNSWSKHQTVLSVETIEEEEDSAR